MKKWARIFLALILVATLSLGGVLPASAKQFQDVTRSGMGEEIFDSINYVSDNGILVGTTSTQFGPNTTLTRAMIVAVLYRWSGDGGHYSNPFTDVYKSDYYYDAVGWAQQNGIVYGTTETQFSPAKPVTTEQFFAFLYRYALKYHPDKTDYTDASITSHPDYSSVLEYARPSFRWAKQHNILQLTNSTYLWPQSGMARKNVALYITRYSLQVKGFDEEDRFSFINASSTSVPYAGFSNSVRMNSTVFTLMQNHLKASLSEALAAKFIDEINNLCIGKSFAGACFGMSAVTYLDKIGKINFKRNAAGGVSTLSQVTRPKYNAAIESVIYYHHFVQKAILAKEVGYTGRYLETGLNNLVSVTKKGPVMFNIYGTGSKLESNIEGVGHSLILLSCEKAPGGYYDLKYVDPNDREIIYDTFDVELSNNVIRSNLYDDCDIRKIGYIPFSSMNIWDSYDFDGIYNGRSYSTRAASTSELLVSYLPSDTATLFVYAKPFRVENAEGQVLEFDGYDFSGDIEILNTETMLNGMDHPCTLLLEVPYSSSFTYHTLSGDAYFGVTTQAYAGSAWGINVDKIQIDSAHRIDLEGTTMEICANGRLVQPTLEYLLVEGTGNDNISIQYTETGADISGLQGEGTLSASHYTGETAIVDEQCVFSPEGTSVNTAKSRDSIQIAPIAGGAKQ